jgi:hypothetical protein
MEFCARARQIQVKLAQILGKQVTSGLLHRCATASAGGVDFTGIVKGFGFCCIDTSDTTTSRSVCPNPCEDRFEAEVSLVSFCRLLFLRVCLLASVRVRACPSVPGFRHFVGCELSFYLEAFISVVAACLPLLNCQEVLLVDASPSGCPSWLMFVFHQNNM